MSRCSPPTGTLVAMSDPAGRVRVVWPIVDLATPIGEVLRDASTELVAHARTSGAELAGPATFTVAPVERVPGAPRVTPLVLVGMAPARRRSSPYRHRARSGTVGVSLLTTEGTPHD